MSRAVINIPFQTVNKNPARGDVYYADLSGIEQSIGSEQVGKRPVLILQNNIGNIHSPTTIVAIMTTKIKRNLPTHVIIHNTNILPDESAICLEQIKTIDKMRLENYCGNVGAKVLKKVDDAVTVSLGMRKTKEVLQISQLIEKGCEGAMTQTKRETIYDGIKSDWISLAEQQEQFFTNIKQYIINLKCDIAQIDKEIEEILNFTETINYNAVQGYKVYKMLKDRRVQRKKLIQESAMLEALIDNFDCEVMRKSYQSGLAKMKNAIQEQESSKAIQELMEMAV